MDKNYLNALKNEMWYHNRNSQIGVFHKLPWGYNSRLERDNKLPSKWGDRHWDWFPLFCSLFCRWKIVHFHFLHSSWKFICIDIYLNDNWQNLPLCFENVARLWRPMAWFTGFNKMVKGGIFFTIGKSDLDVPLFVFFNFFSIQYIYVSTAISEI